MSLINLSSRSIFSEGKFLLELIFHFLRSLNFPISVSSSLAYSSQSYWSFGFSTSSKLSTTSRWLSKALKEIIFPFLIGLSSLSRTSWVVILSTFSITRFQFLAWWLKSYLSPSLVSPEFHWVLLMEDLHIFLRLFLSMIFIFLNLWKGACRPWCFAIFWNGITCHMTEMKQKQHRSKE